MRHCYGFGERQDNCPNEPGGKWSQYFCPDCDEKRIAHLNKRFAQLDAARRPADLQEGQR